MLMRVFNGIFVCVLVFGCAQDLNGVDNEVLDDARVAQKNSALAIDAPSVCSVPCTVSVKGMTDEITSGVQYSANGQILGTSEQWWSDYDFMLPTHLVGPVLLTAQVLSPYGGIIASATSTVVVSSSVDTSTEALIRLNNDGQCQNPCEFTVAVSGLVTEVE